MNHQHSHDHHAHHPAPTEVKPAFLMAAVINLGFVIAEIITAFIAHSMSLFADAGHNFADVLGLFFAFFANRLLQKPPSKRYSYGYKKTTVLAALLNALLLIFSTGIIMYESGLRLFHPHPVNEPLMIFIATLGILINGGTALLFMHNHHHDLNVKSAFIHLAGDALIALGVVATAALILWTKLLWLDPLIGIIISLIIVAGTWRLIVDSVNLILDAVPRNIDQDSVKKYLSSLKGVKAVHDCHIWGLSTRETALTAHLIMPEKLFISDSEYHEINTQLLTQFNIHHVTLQIECGDEKHPCTQSEKC